MLLFDGRKWVKSDQFILAEEVKLILANLSIVILVDLVHESCDGCLGESLRVFLLVHVVEHALDIPQGHHTIVVRVELIEVFIREFSD